MPLITTDEFESLSGFIYRITGIRFEPRKNYYLSKRVEKRMNILGIEDAAEYIRLLRFSDPDHKEFQHLIHLLTINETYFFRDYPQLQAFAENCLQELAEEKERKGKKTIRIWSAGCSSGEEPYTLAIILSEMIESFDEWKVEIVASDIDANVLEKAERAVYEERSIRDVPEEYLKKYFTRTREGRYHLKSGIRRMVGFDQLNFADKTILREKRNFDFIFCRNVLIYFDDSSRKQLVEQFYVALNPGGYIFLGSSESVGRITNAFRLKRAGGYLVYCKE